MTGKCTDKFCSNVDDHNYDHSETSVAEQSAISFVFPVKFYKACANPDHGNICAVINVQISEYSMQVWPENVRIERQTPNVKGKHFHFHKNIPNFYQS